MASRKIATVVILLMCLVGLSALYEHSSSNGKLSAMATAPVDEPQQGQMRPDFPIAPVEKRVALSNYKLTLVNGQTTTISDIAKHGPLVLDFWEIGCGYCRLELPDLNRISAEYKPKGATVICINPGDTPDDIMQFALVNKLSVPMASDKDGKIFNDLGFEGFPIMVLVDRQGRAAALCPGYTATATKSLPEALDKLIAERN